MSVAEHNMMYHPKIIFVFLKGHSLYRVGVANGVPIVECTVDSHMIQGMLLAVPTQSS